MSGQNPREIAVEVLQRRGFVEDTLENFLAKAHLSPADRRLCQELVYGVVRRQATLDWLVERKTQGRVQKPLLQNVLRLGLYQIFWLSRIPNHAAVNETVEIAKRKGFHSQAGFINAVLRGYLREFDATRSLLDQLRQSDPALGYSHPVVFDIPSGIDVAIDKQTHLTVTGIDRQLVGQVAADIRALRKPDPYKQKGVRYTGEVLKKKAGKTGAK